MPETATGVKLSTYRSGNTPGYKVRRFAWSCVQFAFWPHTPRRLSSLRILLLRIFGARIGRHCMVQSSRIWVPWNLEMAEYSVIGDGAEIYNLAPISIGANSVISQRAYLCTATHDYGQSHFPLITRSITVGNSAWIAAGSFIAPGVNIGDGTVIGAYSVVTKEMPDWMVCAGNPCKPLKKRVINDDTESNMGGESGPEVFGNHSRTE